MKKIYLAVVLPLFSGCLATTDLLNSGTLNAEAQEIAYKIALGAKNQCTTHKYREDSGKKVTGDMKIVKMPEIKRLYKSESGWWKAEVAVPGAWDNVYYRDIDAAIICGEKDWQIMPISRKNTFDEVN